MILKRRRKIMQIWFPMQISIISLYNAEAHEILKYSHTCTTYSANKQSHILFTALQVVYV
ncbi:hypothetical protein POKO110462_09115 [Pontibacter korlensis]